MSTGAKPPPSPSPAPSGGRPSQAPGTPPPAQQQSGAFYTTAASMSRSPLGFLGLCLVLVYAVAGVVFAVNQSLPRDLAMILVWFIVLYPVLVLGTFVVLITEHRDKLIWPTEFANTADFLKYEEIRRLAAAALAQGEKNAQDVAALAATSPTPVALRPTPVPSPPPGVYAAPVAPAHAASDDPQFGRWGGQRERNGYRLRNDPIRAISVGSSYYRIPLEVSRTDGQAITGTVRFFLHDSFHPDMEEVTPQNGVAKLELISYGAFTVGVLLADDTKLELNLADADIEAPQQFKDE